MFHLRKITAAIVLASGFWASSALANDQSEDVKSLESKIEALTKEMANLKDKMALPPVADQSYGGMGYGASKVYFSRSPLSIGGYGEVVIENTQGQGTDEADSLRFVPYIGYRFNDWIVFNSELEIEHSGVFGKDTTLTDSNGDTVTVSEPNGEIVLEFAYLDFLLSEVANIRVGHVLIPFGITNIQHEPTLFPSVNRSEVERNIIPTTWHENGLLIHGEFSDFRYVVGTVNGLDASNFSGSSWIRGGRQKGAQAKAENWAAVFRLEWFGVDGLDIGTSIYDGKSSQGNTALNDARVTLWELHGQWVWRGLKLKTLYVQGELSDSDSVSTVSGQTVGKKAKGYYIEGQYNFWQHIRPKSTQVVNVFARHEEYDTHDEVLGTENDAFDRRRLVVGFNYLPISNVIFKVDYQFRENKSAEEADMFELGMGYVF